MRRGWWLTLLASVCIAESAQAQAVIDNTQQIINSGQAVEVPRPYAIPLPPNANWSQDPQWEFGIRYWWSEGDTKFDINSSRVAPILGNPTSVLSYENLEANALEFVWGVRSLSDTVFRGFVGGGWLTGGSLDDEDYFVGQVKFSDTFSRTDGDYLAYGTIDLAQDFELNTRHRVVVSPFIGFNYWQEDVRAYGARCNHDDVRGAFCGPAGSIAVPFGVEVISNKASWSSLRLGTELRTELWNRLSLRADAAIVPVAYLWNEDSHYLRRDLGRTPNIKSEGTGWGYQLEGELRYAMTDNWAFGAGVRYWYAETGGTADFFRAGTSVELNEFASERVGVFTNLTYRFSTY